MHELAKVSVIQSLVPIEGRDRIVLARIENYNSIVPKDEYREGDLAVYVFYDSILPERPEFEFLRKRCWSEKYKGFRIRPMKMGGVISEGLVLPMSVLPEGRNWKKGDVVTDVLGIRLYDPEGESDGSTARKSGSLMRYLMRFSFFRSLFMKKGKVKVGYPMDVPKSDEDNIEKLWDRIEDRNVPFVITEKVEGSAAMYLYGKGFLHSSFRCHSHNWCVEEGVWHDYASSTGLRERMKACAERLGTKRLAISGELIGPGIQKNIYSRPSHELYLYNAYISGERVEWERLVEIASILEIPTVPFVERREIGGMTLDDIISMSEGTSVLSSRVPREGVVWRTEKGDVHFKAKSRPYKVWFDSIK